MMVVLNLLGILQDGNDLADTTPLSSAQPLSLARGESAQLRLQVRGRAGNPIDLANQTVRMVVSMSSVVLSPLLTLDAAVSSPAANGAAVFTITAAQSRRLTAGRYVYSVWVLDLATGAQVQVIPLSALVLAPSTYPSA
jgi:hypothetical protein